MSDALWVAVITGAFGTLNAILLQRLARKVNGRLTQLIEISNAEQRLRALGEGESKGRADAVLEQNAREDRKTEREK